MPILDYQSPTPRPPLLHRIPPIAWLGMAMGLAGIACRFMFVLPAAISLLLLVLAALSAGEGAFPRADQDRDQTHPVAFILGQIVCLACLILLIFLLGILFIASLVILSGLH